MKFIGVVLIIVGVIILVAAYASPSLAIINVNSVAPDSAQLSVINSYPDGSSGSPSQLQYSTSPITISVEFETAAYYGTKITSITNVGGTLTANGVALTPTVTHSDIPIDPQLGTEYITLTLSYSYTPPSPGTTVEFSWSGTITITGQETSYTASSTTTWTGSANYYAYFENPQMSNLGAFYVSLSGSGTSSSENTPIEITNSSVITYNVTSFPVVLTVYYVEINGATTYMNEVYVTFSGSSSNIQLYPVSSSAGSYSTTVDGYQAYANTISISSPGSYTIHGYVKANSTAGGNTVQLMSFGFDIPQNSSTLPTFTINQIVSMIAGAFLVVVGLIGVVTRRF
ncbi:MAG: hypothetical protein QXV17_15180 [Candidatus Micrarchaeaceae archaeon]